MKKTCKIFIFLLFGFQIVNAQDAKYIYSKIVNSTVTIETDKGLGSGFFIADNIIVTNYHVVEGASEIYCYSNNSTIKYEISKYFEVDKKSDLILLYPAFGYHGLTIELKYGKNKLSKEQQDFIWHHEPLGYRCIVCWNWLDAKRQIINYLSE